LELDARRLTLAPHDRSVQFDAAISYANAGAMAQHAGSLDAALSLFERSVALRRRIVASDPADVQAQERLGWVLARIANLHLARNDVGAALQCAREAVSVQQRVFDTTRDRTGRQTLAYAFLELARAQRAARDPRACASYSRAHALFADGGAGEFHPSRTAEAAREAAACAGD
jgi:hypothetical protein